MAALNHRWLVAVGLLVVAGVQLYVVHYLHSASAEVPADHVGAAVQLGSALARIKSLEHETATLKRRIAEQEQKHHQDLMDETATLKRRIAEQEQKQKTVLALPSEGKQQQPAAEGCPIISGPICSERCTKRCTETQISVQGAGIVTVAGDGRVHARFGRERGVPLDVQFRSQLKGVELLFAGRRVASLRAGGAHSERAGELGHFFTLRSSSGHAIYCDRHQQLDCKKTLPTSTAINKRGYQTVLREYHSSPLKDTWRETVWKELASRIGKGGGVVEANQPLIELNVPGTVKIKQMMHRVEEWLLPSMAVFWPREFGRLLIVLEEQDKAQLQSIQRLAEVPPWSQLVFLQVPDVKWPLGVTGYYWQMWAKFHADTFSTAPLVGFVDSDAIFNSLVTADTLLDPSGRPIIIGSTVPSNEDWWDINYPVGTERALGKPEVAKFMSYFPMILWRKHLKLLREHITSHMNCSSFNEAFSVFGAKGFSEFNVIFNYLFHFHRDEYSWHFQEPPMYFKPLSPKHTPRKLPIDRNHNLPVVRIAQHLRYCSYAMWPESPTEIRPRFHELIVEGYCHSSQFVDRICAEYVGRKHEVQLWFDHAGPAWEPGYTVCDDHGALCRNVSGYRALSEHYSKPALREYVWPQFAQYLVKKIHEAGAEWPSPDPKYDGWVTAENTGNKW